MPAPCSDTVTLHKLSILLLTGLKMPMRRLFHQISEEEQIASPLVPGDTRNVQGKVEMFLIGATSRRLSVSEKAPLDQLRLLPLQPTVSPPPGHGVCVTGLNAASLNRSVSAWLQVKLDLKEKSSDPESEPLLCLHQAKNRTKRRCRTWRTRPSETTPPPTQEPSLHLLTLFLPPSLSSPSSVALSPSRVAELTSLFFSPFLFLY